MKDKNGGLAFPQFGAVSAQDDKYDSMNFGGQGMTLLDYFAGQALAALIGISEALCRVNGVDKISKEEFAENAYIYARAMLEEKRRVE